MQLYQLAQPEIATFTIYQMGRKLHNAMVFIGTASTCYLAFTEDGDTGPRRDLI